MYLLPILLYHLSARDARRSAVTNPTLYPITVRGGAAQEARALYGGAVAKLEAVLEADPGSRPALRAAGLALADLAAAQADPGGREARQLLQARAPRLPGAAAVARQRLLLAFGIRGFGIRGRSRRWAGGDGRCVGGLPCDSIRAALAGGGGCCVSAGPGDTAGSAW